MSELKWREWVISAKGAAVEAINRKYFVEFNAERMQAPFTHVIEAAPALARIKELEAKLDNEMNKYELLEQHLADAKKVLEQLCCVQYEVDKAREVLNKLSEIK